MPRVLWKNGKYGGMPTRILGIGIQPKLGPIDNHYFPLVFKSGELISGRVPPISSLGIHRSSCHCHEKMTIDNAHTFNNKLTKRLS